MYRVMVMFDPIQCVATPVDTDTGQPRPSYERPFIPIDIQGTKSQFLTRILSEIFYLVIDFLLRF